MLCACTPFPAYADFYQEPVNIKGVLINSEDEVELAAQLGVSQVITNFPMSWAFDSSRMNAYESYLNAMKRAGISVTVIVLNDWAASSYSPLLLPVSQPAEANYYAFNTLSEEGLDATRKAASLVTGRFKDLVSNWVIGNEVNDGQAWNYIGAMDIDSYCSNYATAFRTWYDAVKGVNSLARVYIPFDFRWNAGQVEGFKFGVMDMLPRLNNLLRDTDYGIAWHAYPEEFDDPVFADDRYALEQANTPIINLKKPPYTHRLHEPGGHAFSRGGSSPSDSVRTGIHLPLPGPGRSMRRIAGPVYRSGIRGGGSQPSCGSLHAEPPAGRAGTY